MKLKRLILFIIGILTLLYIANDALNHVPAGVAIHPKELFTVVSYVILLICFPALVIAMTVLLGYRNKPENRRKEF